MTQNAELDESQQIQSETPLTGPQAAALMQRLGSRSLEGFLVQVFWWQLLAAAVMGMSVWLLWHDAAIAGSAFYGGMCAVGPAGLIAFVVKRRMATGALKRPSDMFVGLFVMQLIKIVTAICMLVAAPVVLNSPHWVAVVAGFVLVLKIYWLVVLLGSKSTGRVHTLG